MLIKNLLGYIKLHFIDVQKYAKLGGYKSWVKKNNSPLFE